MRLKRNLSNANEKSKSTIIFSRNKRETKIFKHYDLDSNYVDYRHDEIYHSRFYERKKRFKYTKFTNFDKNRIE